MAAGVAVAALLALAACGGGTSGDPSPTGFATPTATRATSATPTPDLDPAQAARHAALTAYRAMWDDWVAAAATSDYESSLLAHHASGAALDLIVHSIFDDKLNQVVTKGRPTISPEADDVEPTGSPARVKVVDCVDSTHWLNYKSNGQLQDNIPGGRSHTEALVVLAGGVWKVNQLAIRDNGTC
jgi:hypothetical protein